MKQTKWFIGVVLIIGLVVGGFLIFNKDEVPKTSDTVKTEAVNDSDLNPTTTEADTGVEVTPTTDEVVETAPAVVAGKYVDFSDSLLTSTSIGKKVLFFHASWCPQCRELDASIKAGNIPSGVTIIKVDYDSNQSLRSRYGVTIQTTLVQINAGGDLVKKYVAYEDPSLESLIENAL